MPKTPKGVNAEEALASDRNSSVVTAQVSDMITDDFGEKGEISGERQFGERKKPLLVEADVAFFMRRVQKGNDDDADGKCICGYCVGNQRAISCWSGLNGLMSEINLISDNKAVLDKTRIPVSPLTQKESTWQEHVENKKLNKEKRLLRQDDGHVAEELRIYNEEACHKNALAKKAKLENSGFVRRNYVKYGAEKSRWPEKNIGDDCRRATYAPQSASYMETCYIPECIFGAPHYAQEGHHQFKEKGSCEFTECDIVNICTLILKKATPMIACYIKNASTKYSALSRNWRDVPPNDPLLSGYTDPQKMLEAQSECKVHWQHNEALLHYDFSHVVGIGSFFPLTSGSLPHLLKYKHIVDLEKEIQSIAVPTRIILIDRRNEKVYFINEGALLGVVEDSGEGEFKLKDGAAEELAGNINRLVRGNRKTDDKRQGHEGGYLRSESTAMPIEEASSLLNSVYVVDPETQVGCTWVSQEHLPYQQAARV